MGTIHARLAHFGLYAHDKQRLERFYTTVLGLMVTDSGTARSGMELTFMSSNPGNHHQLVIVGGRPDTSGFNPINQISFMVDSLSDLREVHRRGKGALVVTGHFGLFELGELLLAQSGFRAAALTLPEPSSSLTEWRARFRQRWNVDTIEVGTDSFSFLNIAESLRQGAFVATLVDRPHPSENTPVSWPNGTALFSAGIFLLAAHCEVPVIPATMVRRSDGFYHAQVFPPIFIQERESRAETLRFYSQQIADIFLPVLRAHPEQWYQFVPLSTPPPPLT